MPSSRLAEPTKSIPSRYTGFHDDIVQSTAETRLLRDSSLFCRMFGAKLATIANGTQSASIKPVLDHLSAGWTSYGNQFNELREIGEARDAQMAAAWKLCTDTELTSVPAASDEDVRGIKSHFGMTHKGWPTLGGTGTDLGDVMRTCGTILQGPSEREMWKGLTSCPPSDEPRRKLGLRHLDPSNQTKDQVMSRLYTAVERVCKKVGAE